MKIILIGAGGTKGSAGISNAGAGGNTSFSSSLGINLIAYGGGGVSNFGNPGIALGNNWNNSIGGGVVGTAGSAGSPGHVMVIKLVP
jgi:hypothetical protein